MFLLCQARCVELIFLVRSIVSLEPIAQSVERREARGTRNENRDFIGKIRVVHTGWLQHLGVEEAFIQER